MRHLARRLPAATGVTALALVSLAAPTAMAADDVTGGTFDPSLTKVNILNINDYHGHFSKEFACTLRTQETALGEDSTLFLSAGDNVGGTPFESASQNDEPAMDFLNALDLDASAAGNHEFDQGYADLTDRIVPSSDFPILGANVYRKGTTTPALPEYEVFTVNGVTIGVVGAVTQETVGKVSPDGIATIDFGDPVDAVNRVAAQLKDGDATNGEADIVIAEYHEGADTPEESGDLATAKAGSPVFTRIVDATSADVDVIFNGDKHVDYTYAGPIPGGGGTRPVVQSQQYAEKLGVVQLGIDPTTKTLTQYSMENIDAEGDVTAACEGDATYQQAAQVVEQALAQAEIEGARQVGTLTDDITTAVKTDGSRDDRQRESALGNAIAQSFLDSMQAEGRSGADIGIMNPGGVRAELYYAGGDNPGDADGVITFREAANIMPFNNIVETKDLTGAQFIALLEQQWQPEGSSRPFLKLGLSDNVTYTYDPDAPAGERITTVMVDGALIDEAATYTIASSSFLMAGGDNFTVLAEGTNKKDTGLIDQSLFVEWIGQQSPLSPVFVKHAVAVSDQPTAATAGEQVSFTASGFDLTSMDAPTNAEVEVFAGDVSLGTFPITPGLIDGVPTRNGTADITVTIPESLSGTVMLRLVAAPTGTVASFPLEVTAVEPSPTPTDSPSPTQTPSPTDSPTTDGDTATAQPTTPDGTATGPVVETDAPGHGPASGAALGAFTGLTLLGTLLGAAVLRRSALRRH